MPTPTSSLCTPLFQLIASLPASLWGLHCLEGGFPMPSALQYKILSGRVKGDGLCSCFAKHVACVVEWSVWSGRCGWEENAKALQQKIKGRFSELSLLLLQLNKNVKPELAPHVYQLFTVVTSRNSAETGLPIGILCCHHEDLCMSIVNVLYCKA